MVTLFPGWSRKSVHRWSSSRRGRSAVLKLEGLEDRSVPAVVTWDGGGGDFNWNNAANWNANNLPTLVDDVVINVPTDITVTHSSGNTAVRSLTSQENLSIAGGTFRVTVGASVVNGALSVSGKSTLTAQFTGVSFTANGDTSVSDCSLQAFNGAILNLSHATSFTGSTGSTFSASSGGTLNLSGLTTVSGPLSVTAANGGLVNLSSVTAFAGGTASFSATSANSLIDLSQLVAFNGNAPSIILVLGGQIRCANLNLPSGSLVSGIGTLIGNVTNGGLIRPGLNTFNGTGIIAITGDYVQSPTGVLATKINGLTAGSQYDRLAVAGAATLGGTLNVTRPTGFVPTLGNSFQVLTFASRTGDFGTKNGLSIDSTKRFDPVFDPAFFQLVTAPSNRAPVLDPVGNRGVDEGSLLSFAVHATDPDVGDSPTYSLDAGAPAGATIDPLSGVFTWLPPDGFSEVFVTVRATDGGSPALSDFETIRITVANVDPVVSAGGDEAVPKSSPFVRGGSFSDPGADEWTATVNYGDDTGDLPLEFSDDKSFELDHQFASAGQFTVTVTINDDDGGSDTTTFELTVLPPPTVLSIVLEDGSVQRSMVRSVTVTFDTVVALDAGAFQLVRLGGGLVSLNTLSRTVNGQSVVTVTFASGTDLPGTNRSLADGDYRFTIVGSAISGNLGQRLDGDADGNEGGDRLWEFHRLFGDADGDHDVDRVDRTHFMSSFRRHAGDSRYLWYFDYDGDGEVDPHDLVQFNRRFG